MYPDDSPSPSLLKTQHSNDWSQTDLVLSPAFLPTAEHLQTSYPTSLSYRLPNYIMGDNSLNEELAMKINWDKIYNKPKFKECSVMKMHIVIIIFYYYFSNRSSPQLQPHPCLRPILTQVSAPHYSPEEMHSHQRQIFLEILSGRQRRWYISTHSRTSVWNPPLASFFSSIHFFWSCP